MARSPVVFHAASATPMIIAGPCMAESEDLLHTVARPLVALSRELGFELIFKASFDKANRTAIKSYRGPGLTTAMGWFQTLKQELGVRLLTDVHETAQCGPVAETCEVLQIPAFLCRQTDLIVAAVETGRAVNVKKGQFIGPDSIPHIASKVKAAAAGKGFSPDFALTERGVSFGYGNLVVDLRALKTMAAQGGGVIFDVTHSLQLPGTGGTAGEVTGGAREYAPLLTRAAAATGYLTGLFLEVHPEPAKALSDASTQLTIEQATTLLRQVIPIWKNARSHVAIDRDF